MLLMAGSASAGRRPRARDTAGCRDCSRRTACGTSPSSRNAAIDPDSAKLIVDYLNQEVNRERAARIGPWIDTDSYSTPLYIVGPKQRRVKRGAPDANAAWRKGLQQVFTKVPIPPNARPAAGTDGHMTIWQP